MEKHSERIAKRKREDLLLHILHRVTSDDCAPPLTQREKQLIKLATKEKPYSVVPRGIEESDITSFAESCAYYIVTQQPCDIRDVELPRHETQMAAWRLAQAILFIILLLGILPPDMESYLPRWLILVIFLAFTAISAWCRYCDKWYSKHQRETAILNELVSEYDIKLILCSKEFAKGIMEYYTSPDCQHKKELLKYLSWWHEYHYFEGEPFESWVKHPTP